MVPYSSFSEASFPQDLPALGFQMAWYLLPTLSFFLSFDFHREVLMDAHNLFYQILVLSTSYCRTDISAAPFLRECQYGSYRWKCHLHTVFLLGMFFCGILSARCSAIHGNETTTAEDG